MIDYTDLLGKPFSYESKGPEAYSCWTLAREAARRFGSDVPDWPVSSDGIVNHATVIEAIAAGYQRLDAPEVGCFVVFRLPLGPHIGVVVAPDRFLHVTKSTRACTERLSAPLWKDRIVGFYRWKGNDER